MQGASSTELPYDERIKTAICSTHIDRTGTGCKQHVILQQQEIQPQQQQQQQQQKHV